MKWIKCTTTLGSVNNRCTLHNAHQFHNIPHSDSNLVAHAMRELLIIGEEWETIKGVCATAQAYADMHNSGGSHSVLLPWIVRLLDFENLTALTNDPDEWTHHGPDMWGGNDGRGVWQNIRNSKAFSEDEGRTYRLVFEEGHELHYSKNVLEENQEKGGDENGGNGEPASPGSGDGAGPDGPGGTGEGGGRAAAADGERDERRL